LSSWIVYDLLCCSDLSRHEGLLAGLILAWFVLLAWTLSTWLSGRAAYIHVGAAIGTIMVANVFRVIIPAQKDLVNAVTENRTPAASKGRRALQRSRHNNYFTLPVLFIMISSHYPMTYASANNWVILLVIMAITAVARQYFVLAHKKVNRPMILVGAAFATLILAIVMAPKTTRVEQGGAAVSVTRVQGILQQRCASCHSAMPTDDVLTVEPGGVMLDTLEEMQRLATRIKARSRDTHDMPFMNKTGMTDEERELVNRWVISGAPGA